MRCVDVNVLVNAHRPEAPQHERHREWLEEARTADEPLGLADLVLSGFLRVVTHPRVFREPTPLSTWYSPDRGFGRFPNLDWRVPVPVA